MYDYFARETDPAFDIVVSCWVFLRRDRGAGCGGAGMGGASSTFSFFARLDGTVRAGSGDESGLFSRPTALRFKMLEGLGTDPETEVEVAVAVAAAAAVVKVSAASLAAERVTLEDMRTSSVLSGRQRPSA